MYQQEIKFFWPLTEQIPLDLDCTESDNYVRQKLWSTSSLHGVTVVGNGGTTINLYDPSQWNITQRIGPWEIPTETKQPSKFQKFFMKYFLGWKWMGK